MNRKEYFKNRLIALIMTAALTLSLAVPAFAEESVDSSSQNQVEVGTEAEASEANAEPAAAEDAEAAEEVALTGADEESSSGSAAAEAETGSEEAEAAAGSETAAEEDSAAVDTEEDTEAPALSMQEAESGTETAAAAVGTISVKAAGDEKYITAVWTAFASAEYYIVSLDSSTGHKVSASAERKYVFANVSSAALHKVSVKAYGANNQLIAEGSAENISAVIRSKLSSFTTKASKQNINLRKKLGEGYNGYSVAQGVATDGTYVYYMMVSSYTQKGRVLKVRLSDNKIIKKGPIIAVHHSNGMCYDSKRKRLVCIGCGSYRNQLVFVNPDTLTIIKKKKIKYPYSIEGVPQKANDNGIAAISYIAKYDVYLARSRGRNNGHGTGVTNNDLWVIKAGTREAIGHIYTKVTAKYPATYQAMDADEKYAYFLLSPGPGQSKNIILALDWNSENLLPVLNGEKTYIEKIWNCGNNGSGKPDAVIRIPVKHESEGLFHTTDANGKSHFYLSEYYGRWKYKTVTRTKKVKVKWKKVWKKVKWKKVKKNGKWKWKYKKKKVWKYKIKKKKYKVKVRSKWKRDDYVYDLGVF